MERRQKSGVVPGRPSGTDGFDFSYRMTVEQRYQKVALRKAQLYRLLMSQVACQALGILWIAFTISEGKELPKIALLALTSGIMAFSIGEIGRRRSNSILLKIFISLSTFATALSVACGSSGHFAGVFIRDSDQKQEMDSLMYLLDTLETIRVLVGVVLEIIAMLATISLLNNMSPRRTA